MTEQFDPIEEARRQWVAHGWEAAADGMATITRVVRVHQLVQSAVEGVLKPHGLTFARFEVLRLLAFSRSGGMRMGRLGELLQVKPASVTNAVSALEAQGHVERTPNPDDGRGTIATITASGRRVVEPATADLNRWFAAVDGDPATRRLARDLLHLEQHLGATP